MALLTLLQILGQDLLFIGVLVLLTVPMGIYRQAAFAVLKRNFVGYFSNPTGYVFLCLFVLLTSFATFWPHEFFTANLANFDQLNRYLPFIMLVFIPAITMSIWAEERRQGTDELLLTLPTTDLDIVIGKYLAAVFVFTVSLLFSQLSNCIVLVFLTHGDLDTGLLFTTYLGYWFVGISMLALGMVASFLTNNLTVGFIFGAALNAPLAFFSRADVIIPWANLAESLKHWSLLDKFEVFGRGVIGLVPVIYFLSIIFISLYLCLVLIGRRHWLGGKDGTSMFFHFLVRAGAIVLGAISLNLIAENTLLNRVRLDQTEGRIGSLSTETKQILRRLSQSSEQTDGETGELPPVVIDAFIGADVPPEYAQTRYDLINLLREFNALGGKRVQVNLQTGMKPFSEEAVMAEKRFNIRPVRVPTRSRGAVRVEEVILGAAFSCGLERVVVPFFEYGVPVEYELIRSINTVAKTSRKTIGILHTDAALMGGPTMVGMQPQMLPKERLIAELEKQFNVEVVDPNTPINVWIQDSDDATQTSLRYDVLFVAQPSSLDPRGMQNLINAIGQGQPTALFEDPFPLPGLLQSTPPATSEPKRPTGMMAMMGRGQPIPKGDIRQLWSLLGIKVRGSQGSMAGFQPDIVWQDYNPYPRQEQFRQSPEFVFIRPELIPNPADVPYSEHPFNQDHEVTSNLDEVLLPFAGAIQQADSSPLTFTPLMTSGNAGVIRYPDLAPILFGMPLSNVDIKRGNEFARFVMAAHVTGKVVAPPPATDPTTPAVPPQAANINVVYVADVDCLASEFVNLRNKPNQGAVSFRFQNLTFVLNVIDSLAGVDDYLNIRKRSRHHKTLKAVEEQIEVARDQVYQQKQQFEKDFQDAFKQAQRELDEAIKPYNDAVDDLEKKRQNREAVDYQVYNAKVFLRDQEKDKQQRKLDNQRANLERKRNENIRQIERDTDLQIQKLRTSYKVMSVLWPPIPPLLVGLIVFARRRLREREGISRARLR